MGLGKVDRKGGVSQASPQNPSKAQQRCGRPARCSQWHTLPQFLSLAHTWLRVTSRYLFLPLWQCLLLQCSGLLACCLRCLLTQARALARVVCPATPCTPLSAPERMG